MKLKTYIQFALFTILLLFVLNFASNFWSMHQKNLAVEQLQQETALLAITISIKQGIGDIQNQIDRLGQLPPLTASPLDAAEKDKIEAQSARVAGDITRLKAQAQGELLDKVVTMQTHYMQLAASWHLFSKHFGDNSGAAMTEYALHAGPFSQQLLYQELPAIEVLENNLIEQARQRLHMAKGWSERMALGIFMASLLAVLVLALRLHRRIVGGMRAFAPGIAALSAGGDAHIGLQSADELGEIAGAFDALSNKLQISHKQCGELEQSLVRCNAEVEALRQESQALLRNILPATIADEFRNRGAVQPKYLEDVTILFTDFVGFSSSSERLAAEDLVHALHDYFSAFDEICSRYGLEKLKTIGDSYMCAGGLPERNPSHPVDAVMAAMEMLQVVNERRGRHADWSIRIGIHTGHLIAGMVGKQKFAYDIWGESVNYASRVESSGEPNRIALSAQTYGRIKDFFECERRVKTHVKVAHKMELYLVNGFAPNLIEDAKQMPPEAFVRRYRGYFEKEPPSFPSLSAIASTKVARKG